MFNLILIGGVLLLILLALQLRQYLRGSLLPKRLLEAEKLIGVNDAKALEQVNYVLALDRKNLKGRWLAVLLYLRKNQQILAKMTLFDILHSGEFSADVTEKMVREELARIYETLSEGEKALFQYYQLREQHLLSREGYKRLIRLLIERGKSGEAEAILLELSEKGESDGELLYLDALLQFEKKNFKAAEARAERSLEKQYRDPDLILLLGKSLFINQKFAESLSMFQKLPKEYFSLREVESMLGQCFFHMHDYETAIATLEKNRGGGEASFILGSAYENRGQIDKAVRVWNEIAPSESVYGAGREKIHFYSNVVKDSRIRAFLMAPFENFHAAVQQLLQKLSYSIKQTIYEDEKNLEYFCVNQDNYYSIDPHYVVISRQTAPVDKAYIDSKVKALQTLRGKYLLLIAPYIPEGPRANAQGWNIQLHDFEIFIRHELLKDRSGSNEKSG